MRSEELGLKEKAAEEAMLRLRLLVEGLAADEMVRRFGEDGTAGTLSPGSMALLPRVC